MRWLWRIRGIWLSLVLLAGVAEAATLGPTKIGGSGPIDRPTAHVGYWCYNEWSCGQYDTFTADGDSATVEVIARNWNSMLPSQAMAIRLDNFFVVETGAFNAALAPIGSVYEPFLGEFQCANGSGDLMLDFNALAPADIAYETQFDAGIGSEWSFDVQQVLYLTQSAMDDPFNPGGLTTTGCMRVGSGSGPEFVTATLQLTGLTPGTNYTIAYWWASLDEFPANCSGGNDDLELVIYGEEIVCTPDSPELELLQVRTLDWNPATNLWRIQALFQNLGPGPALGLGITLEDVSAGLVITESWSWMGDVAAAPGSTIYSGPFEIDLSSQPGSATSTWLQFLFEYDDDCDSYRGDYRETTGSFDPLRWPTPAPALRHHDLEQNVPNPFNPRTTIAFELSGPGFAELAVYDAQGRLVRTLFRGHRPAGPQSATWDGRDDSGRFAAAGVYFYALDFEGVRTQRKMVLLK